MNVKELEINQPIKKYLELNNREEWDYPIEDLDEARNNNEYIIISKPDNRVYEVTKEEFENIKEKVTEYFSCIGFDEFENYIESVFDLNNSDSKRASDEQAISIIENAITLDEIKNNEDKTLRSLSKLMYNDMELYVITKNNSKIGQTEFIEFTVVESKEKAESLLITEEPEIDRWWNDKSISIYEIDGKNIALGGWNGEKYTNAFQVVGKNNYEVLKVDMEIEPIYKETSNGDYNVVGFNIIDEGHYTDKVKDMLDKGIITKDDLLDLDNKLEERQQEYFDQYDEILAEEDFEL